MSNDIFEILLQVLFAIIFLVLMLTLLIIYVPFGLLMGRDPIGDLPPREDNINKT
jgi:hypothetical protein